MGLVKLTFSILENLEQHGYTRLIQTSPSELEDLHIKCTASKAIKFIPYKDTRDISAALLEGQGDEFLLSLEDAKHKFASASKEALDTQFLIDEKFVCFDS